MPPNPPRRRSLPGGQRSAGFSLIELLIVVAIIAALVGVAVPFFRDNVAEAQRAKALEDLEILRKAIARYESERELLVGTNLDPLLGRYMQEIPKDPWGNRYLWDGSAGLLISFGADGFPGGEGGDMDIFRAIVADGGQQIASMPVMPRRVQYQGSWGPPRPSIKNGIPDPTDHKEGNKVIITFTRPLVEADPARTPELMVFRLPLDSAGQMPVASMTDPSSFPVDTWYSAGTGAWGPDPMHRPQAGILVIHCVKDTLNEPGGPWTPMRPAMLFDMIDPEDVPGPPILATSRHLGANPASPLDDAVYGPRALDYRSFVVGPPKPQTDLFQGLQIEKY